MRTRPLAWEARAMLVWNEMSSNAVRPTDRPTLKRKAMLDQLCWKRPARLRFSSCTHLYAYHHHARGVTAIGEPAPLLAGVDAWLPPAPPHWEEAVWCGACGWCCCDGGDCGWASSASSPFVAAVADADDAPDAAASWWQCSICAGQSSATLGRKSVKWKRRCRRAIPRIVMSR